MNASLQRPGGVTGAEVALWEKLGWWLRRG